MHKKTIKITTDYSIFVIIALLALLYNTKFRIIHKTRICLEWDA